VIGAASTLLWALPATVRFAPDAPGLFWAMVLAALLVDAPLFGLASREDSELPSTLSVCFTFPILLLWGALPAIVVATAAAAVTVMGRRHRPGAGALLAARSVCAIVATELFVTAVRLRPFNAGGSGVAWLEAVEALSAACIWLVVSYAILGVARAAGRPGGLWRAVKELRSDLFGTATSVALVSPLPALATEWWQLLLLLPVLGWSAVLRGQMREKDRLSREPITGLLNRRGLTAGVRALMAQDHVAPNRPRPFAVVLINVDPILMITSTLGRDLAEKVIGAASRRLIEAYGASRVGQLSGETFVLLLPDVDEVEALAEAEKAVRLLAPAIEIDDIPFVLEPACGLAMSPEHGRELGILLMKSGLAADAARRRGRHAVIYRRQAAAVTQRRMLLLSQMHLALRDPERHDEIAIAYQPQVDIASGCLLGVEALLRWTHPRLGLIPTSEVIQAVESSQVIRLLTRYVLRSVAVQLQSWNEEGLHVRGSVNVSVLDLHDPGFVAEMQDVLASHRILPEQLMVEITERTVADAGAARAACALRELGVGLSLDDFGSGHASLHQLRQLPLTEVKIDQAYVRTMVENPADLAIVTSVHQLASALHFAVVAEGVETPATAIALAEFAGTIGQGYYFGHPMPANGLRQWTAPVLASRGMGDAGQLAPQQCEEDRRAAESEPERSGDPGVRGQRAAQQ
jgi:diguanylate cyclase (GGDEF)-like protein